MDIKSEAVRLARLNWPPRLIRQELNVGRYKMDCLLRHARTDHNVDVTVKGYAQDGTFKLPIAGAALRQCLDLSKVLNLSPRDVAELALNAALNDPELMGKAVKSQVGACK